MTTIARAGPEEEEGHKIHPGLPNEMGTWSGTIEPSSTAFGRSLPIAGWQEEQPEHELQSAWHADIANRSVMHFSTTLTPHVTIIIAYYNMLDQSILLNQYLIREFKLEFTQNLK